MRMEEGNNSSGAGKRLLIVMAGILAVFLVYYTTMSVASVRKKIKEMNEDYRYKPDEKNKTDERIFKDSLYLALLKEKALVQSKVTMAETDSLYLSINLPDSTIDLEISGVSVHSCRIKRFRVSKMLRKGDEFILASMFMKPVTIAKNYSSIKKMPLVIKMAPKDTSEFKPDIMVDTSVYEPVNYIMEADSGLRILVYQVENINPGDKAARFMFDLRYRFRDLLSDLKSVCTFKIPDYHPYIRMRIPRTDAKVLFRALPEHGQVSINL